MMSVFLVALTYGPDGGMVDGMEHQGRKNQSDMFSARTNGINPSMFWALAHSGMQFYGNSMETQAKMNRRTNRGLIDTEFPH